MLLFSKDITDAIMTQMSEIELQITTDYLKRTFCYCCGKQETEPLGHLKMSTIYVMKAYVRVSDLRVP